MKSGTRRLNDLNVAHRNFADCDKALINNKEVNDVDHYELLKPPPTYSNLTKWDLNKKLFLDVTNLTIKLQYSLHLGCIMT